MPLSKAKSGPLSQLPAACRQMLLQEKGLEKKSIEGEINLRYVGADLCLPKALTASHPKPNSTCSGFAQNAAIVVGLVGVEPVRLGAVSRPKHMGAQADDAKWGQR